MGSNRLVRADYVDGILSQRNYITNSVAWYGLTGWSTYADAAGNVPVDGTGGTATGLTFSRNTATPLRDSGSFQLAQANSTSLQGKGVSSAFSIDPADQGATLQIAFDYNASATFIASNGITPPLNDGTTTTNAGNSDIEVFIYDVTNAVLIPVSPQVMTGNGTTNFRFKGTFQTSVTSTSYRLILHVATTSANATGWTFKFDNVYVGSQVTALGAAMSDWTSYAPTLIGVGTATNNTAYWRRIGDSVQVQGRFTAGTTTGSNFSVSLPPGLSLDSSKLNSSRTNVLGYIQRAVNSSSPFASTTVGPFLIIDSTGTTLTNVYASNTAVGYALDLSSGSNLMNASENAFYSFTAPISGWSSNSVMSNETDTRVVDFAGTKGASQACTANVTDVTFTAVRDSHGGWSGSVYTVPVAGDYIVTGTGADVSSNPWSMNVFKNGVQNRVLFTQGGSPISGTALITGLVAGDTLSIRISQTQSINGGTGSAQAQCNIFRLSGPASITAHSVVYAEYNGNGGQSITANVTDLTFTNKTKDTHSAWNGTQFTAPVSGFYQIEGMSRFTATVISNHHLYVNTVQNKRIAQLTATYDTVPFACSVFLNAGDIASIRSGQTGTLSNDTVIHWISFQRLGGVG